MSAEAFTSVGVRTRTVIGDSSRWRGEVTERAWRLARGTLGGVTDFGSLAGGGAPCPERKLKSRRPVSLQVLTPRRPLVAVTAVRSRAK